MRNRSVGWSEVDKFSKHFLLCKYSPSSERSCEASEVIRVYSIILSTDVI